MKYGRSGETKKPCAGRATMWKFSGSKRPERKSLSLPCSTMSTGWLVRVCAEASCTEGGVFVPGVFTVIHCDLSELLPDGSVAGQCTSVRLSTAQLDGAVLTIAGSGSARSNATAVPIATSAGDGATEDSTTRFGGASKIGGSVS